MQAIRIFEFGGSDVLTVDDVPIPRPGPGQALIRVAAAGVNFIDTYHRTGLYPLKLPLTLGQEGAGVVEAVGEGVASVVPGQRVGWAMAGGSYADYVVVSAAVLVPIPDSVSLDQAAAALLQGMTAHYLCTSTYELQPGQWCLVHAGAGGVGLLLTQMCKIIGAKVISTVSTAEKEQLSRAAGADEVINYLETDFPSAVAKITAGKGVSVVFDGVGKSTVDGSLRSLAPRGMLALFGNASGAPDPIEPLLLNRLGSLFLTRPSLGEYIATPEDLAWRAGDLFGWIGSGKLHLRVEFVFPLADAATAHDLLEGRLTTGKVLLKTASAVA